MSNSLDCPRFERCSAPLCPLDPDSLKHGIWYPDEEICKCQKVNKLDWIRRQRELSRKALPDLYFTYKMLNHSFKIRKGVKGLDPDKPESREEFYSEEWLKAHPEQKKQELTSQQLEGLKRMVEIKKRGL